MNNIKPSTMYHNSDFTHSPIKNALRTPAIQHYVSFYGCKHKMSYELIPIIFMLLHVKHE